MTSTPDGTRAARPRAARSLGLLALAALVAAPAWAQQDLERRQQDAIRAAVARAAPSVVRIETVGDLDAVGRVRVGSGPSTGLVVSADGYVISSAFHFAQRPSSILVVLPDGSRLPATLVARDESRMLVLLKIDPPRDLAVPEPTPLDELRVGQWSVAVGRAYDVAEPNISVGIVSALDRIWGKAVQTDAKISPSNYGGPLVDIHGRVIGVLVPMTPDGDDAMAGAEWYDSGIGFAVPLEDIQQALPRLQAGADLAPGLLGVSLAGRDVYAEGLVIAACRPNSPAFKAGIRAGDRIVAIDGQNVARQAELKHRLHPKYAGDVVRIAVARGDERLEHDVVLTDKLEPFQHPFLGLLPMRDAGQGVVVRHVFADSPAAKAQIMPGDRIVSLDDEPLAGRDALIDLLNARTVGEAVRLTIDRGEETLTFDLDLAGLTDVVPPELPPAHAAPGEQDEVEKPAVGQIDVRLPEFKNACWVYVPEDYDPRRAHGVVLWLDAAEALPDEQLLARWRPMCEAHDLILLAPRPAEENRWRSTDEEFVRKALDRVISLYEVDPARVVIHGRAEGAALASLIAFKHRDLIRGAALVNGPFAGRLLENEPVERLSLHIALSADADETARAVVEQLRTMRYAVTLRTLAEGADYLDDEQFAELLRWIDSLDKL